MAMIPCAECAQQISSTAIACPHCGAVYRSLWFKIGATVAIVVGVTWLLSFVLAAAAVWMTRKPIEIDLPAPPSNGQTSLYETPAPAPRREVVRG